jgi:hypothetical protein
MDWKHLSIDISRLDFRRLLSQWRWIVPQTLRPFSLTIFGDWFFLDDQGHVLFLDTVGGNLSEIAPSRRVFLAEREKSENLDEWYMADLAELCWERGLRPGSGQCLSFKVPPVLSGSLEFENVEICDLMVHESIIGQIHRGVKNLPEGTVIDRLIIDGEEP